MLEKFHDITELLQYLSVAALVIDAAGTLTKVGETFTTQWAIEDYILLANAGLNNGQIHQITDVEDTVITVNTTSVAGVALQTETINTTLSQVFYTPWRNVQNYDTLISVVNASQNCTGYMEQSFDRSVVHFSKTQAVVGGTAKSDTDTLYALYARMKFLNGAANQTTFTAYLAGRVSH